MQLVYREPSHSGRTEKKNLKKVKTETLKQKPRVTKGCEDSRGKGVDKRQSTEREDTASTEMLSGKTTAAVVWSEVPFIIHGEEFITQEATVRDSYC